MSAALELAWANGFAHGPEEVEANERFYAWAASLEPEYGPFVTPLTVSFHQ